MGTSRQRGGKAVLIAVEDCGIVALMENCRFGIFLRTSTTNAFIVCVRGGTVGTRAMQMRYSDGGRCLTVRGFYQIGSRYMFRALGFATGMLSISIVSSVVWRETVRIEDCNISIVSALWSVMVIFDTSNCSQRRTHTSVCFSLRQKASSGSDGRFERSSEVFGRGTEEKHAWITFCHRVSNIR